MRKLVQMVALAAVLAVGVPAAASAQGCAGCFLLGLAVGSSGNTQDGGVGMVMFRESRLAERIAKPLEIRVAATPTERYISKGIAGRTFQEIFNKNVENPSDYAILEVIRVFYGSSPDIAVFWFAYIEKNKLAPLSSLQQKTN